MAQYLKVDFNTLASTIRNLSNEIEALESAKNTVENAMDDLQASNWDSDGKNRFFADYTDTWKTNIDLRIQQITELVRDLKSVQSYYELVYSKQKTLTNILL